MNRDLGVWTCEDCALVLIDYQKEMFEVIRSETNADLVELNVRLLAKTAKAFDMPIVLSTVGEKFGFNGPTRPAILDELPGVQPIDRTSMNALEDRAFREAVKNTARKRRIALRSNGCRVRGPYRLLRSRFSPSCSETGPRPRRRRRTKSSTGISPKSRS